MVERKPRKGKQSAGTRKVGKKNPSKSSSTDLLKIINKMEISEVSLCSSRFANFSKVYSKDERQTEITYSGEINAVKFGDDFVVGFCDFSAAEKFEKPLEDEKSEIFDIDCSYLFLISKLPPLNNRLKKSLLEYIGKNTLWPYFVNYLNVLNGIVDLHLPKLPNTPKRIKINLSI